MYKLLVALVAAIIVLLLPACLGANESVSSRVLPTCPHLEPYVYSPTCENYVNCSEPTLVALEGRGSNFEISDVEETFSFTTLLYIIWPIQCALDGVQHDSFYYLDPDKYWKPHIEHSNAIGDHGLTGFMSRFGIHFRYDNFGTFFQWQRSGIMDSVCNLNLTNFPFDVQTCTVDFIMEEVATAATFSPNSTFVVTAREWNEPTLSGDEWILLEQSMVIRNQQAAGHDKRAVIHAVIKIKRKPVFFVYNIIVPCTLLACLQLFAFSIPGKNSDRPIFCMTILMTLVFLNSQVVQFMPQKAQRSFIASYCDFFTYFSFVVTSYSLVICGLAQDSFFQRKLPRVRKFLKNRFVDAFVFCIALLCFMMNVLYAVFVATADN